MHRCRAAATLAQPTPGGYLADGFIPLAEQQNLISALTCFVIREAVKYLEQFPKMHEFYTSLNVAASHFKDSVIIEYLYCHWFPFHPKQQLILELTGRDTLPEVGQRVVHDLHHLEVKLTIDDFDTGQSSHAYLEILNPDIFKN